MKDKIKYEYMSDDDMDNHVDEMFEVGDEVKEEVGKLIDKVIEVMEGKSPLFMLSVLSNASVKIVADNAPDGDFATTTLHATVIAMEKSLQIMIDDNMCRFQQDGGRYEQ